MFALVVGMPMGVYTGLHRDSPAVPVFLTVSLIGISLPPFLIGILLILVFAVWLGWLPSFGRGQVVDLGGWRTGFLTISGLKALILPSITLALFQLTLIMRLVRAEMLEVLRTDYIKFARARGLTDRAVNFGHALKNTLVPVITITGLQLGSIIAFAIITETVFQWPGMGLMFLQAIHNVDIPIMSAYLILIAFFFVVINLVVDLLYYVVDPRLRVDAAMGGGHERPERRRADRPKPAIAGAAGCRARARQRSRLQLPASRRSRSAAIVTLTAVRSAALFAPWIAPHNPSTSPHLNLIDGLHCRRSGSRAASATSCSAPTTRAATSSRPSSTARASRCWSAWPRSPSRRSWASRSGCSAAISAAPWMPSSCASPTCSSPSRRS